MAGPNEANEAPARCARFRVVKHAESPDYAGLLKLTESVLVLGDATKVLAAMPTASVQSVVTSPPYWSLHDYGIDGQVGLEDSVYDFIGRLVSMFEEVRRVLRDDGTLWLNIGDSYTSGGRTWRAPDRKNQARAMCVRPPTPDGLKPKDPALVAARQGRRFLGIELNPDYLELARARLCNDGVIEDVEPGATEDLADAT